VRREREQARFRLHLVKHKSSPKSRIHSTMITFGHPCPVTLFGVAGRELLDRLEVPQPWRGTIDASLELIDDLEYWDPETEEAAVTLELAIPLLEDATGGQVEGRIGDTDPLVAVREALEREPFDEVIVSTLPARVSHWLHRDLPSRVEQLGVAVTVVTARTSSRRLLAEW
jgi:hypothetical protein